MDATTITLLDGLTDADGRSLVKSRDDGSVHTLHGADGSTVAEVCCGKTRTRLNFRAPSAELTAAAEASSVVLSGRSKSWTGGGIVVDDGNVAACRAVLLAVVGIATPNQAADDAAATTADADDADDAAAADAAARAATDAEQGKGKGKRRK